MLLGVVFLLSGQTLAGSVEVVIRDAVTGQRRTNVTVLPKQALPEVQGSALSPAQIRTLAEDIKVDTLSELLVASAIAVGVMVLFACVVGWWVAGRVLRPLHTITSRARGMSAGNIHERLALTGPDDELRALADTFDDMLDRLDRAFTSQARFVANASHELRTPLAVERALIQVRLADGSPDDPAAVRAELLAANHRLERLLEGLLLLARGDHGLPERHPVDLAAVATRVVSEALANPPTGAPEVRGEVRARSLVVAGDEVLLAQLVDNLVRNAMLYNIPGGWFTVTVDDRCTVSNSGPVISQDTVDGLFEPFRRGAGDRLAGRGGAGLGLAIVRSIAEAHDGTVTAAARPDGGLEVAVTLPTP
ncbi:HAMP domain-containing histidine kinase [Actinokineospora enzanensis]|uniref:HAMP domain-containing histidine kinase n=1 Tax=Actinokineospora enzanensis TaxID=155975 RepID=UPI000367A11E|nr:HAMP domain-containing histidine kinase [Actinokineospora enzanensis]